MEKTYYPKAKEIKQEWILVDANGQNLGRLASQIAYLLLGKHKPNFTPGVEMGDYVVVINAERIQVTGKKMTEKFYYRHSGYPGGLKAISLRDLLAKHPERVIRLAVWGMLPKNRLGRRLIKNLKVYAGPDHPHQAQKPKPLTEGA
ncbi:MAG: 50S ribosomal protein L13 [Anaerolineales bacterium]|nr:50S ribosomal protein L13 [Anaerolineales bacterium]MCS7249060.1 50S ribosomal protein L13 [Anaerolineales bacterium]MDW8162873.1 50S ribosomal protein L13 [Anaerolineales bacterium]MDW8446840.1 50S ribosomal protein L13 [Anaerolineales bacterium]